MFVQNLKFHQGAAEISCLKEPYVKRYVKMAVKFENMMPSGINISDVLFNFWLDLGNGQPKKHICG